MSDMMTNRELDALIADKVMGLNVIARDWLCGYEPECGNYEAATDKDDTLGCSWFNERGPVYDANGYIQPVPFYSTDIRAATKVAETFDQGITLFRNLWANGEWHWHCHIGGSISEPDRSWAEELTAPMAICKTALQVIENE